jgi:hypothetical protein
LEDENFIWLVLKLERLVIIELYDYHLEGFCFGGFFFEDYIVVVVVKYLSLFP